MVFNSAESALNLKPSSPAFIKMFVRPDMSLTSTRRELPTASGDVLVAARHAVNRVDVHPALVRKRRRADPRLARVVAQVRDFVHELGKFLELRQGFFRHANLLQLEMQQRDDADQIAIARALTVTVDGALHLRRAGGDARERIRHAHAASSCV